MHACALARDGGARGRTGTGPRQALWRAAAISFTGQHICKYVGIYVCILLGIFFGEGLSVSPFFTAGLCVCIVCVCVLTHTRTACGVLGCEPRCRDKTPGEPENNPDVL